MIDIWQPRWKDRKVLIATYKVKPGKNKVTFSKTKCLPGVYEVEGKDIVKYPVESNGTIGCYAVPLDVVVGEKKELS